LACAQNIFDAVDRRSPEAGALASWIGQNAASFGLPDSAVLDDDDRRSRKRGVNAADWRKVGAALLTAADSVDHGSSVGDEWIRALSQTLIFDAWTTRILALALGYKLDNRVERLFDAVSECRGNQSVLIRDAGLFGLLLHAPAAEMAKRLAPGGQLFVSGVLHLDQWGAVQVLDRLVSLIRQDILPGADLFDQLLGSISAAPLEWDAFAHLGAEAEVAARLLTAALAGRETGINILLYGPPGTGKTSFASTLARRVGARLRPVCEQDESGGEPSRGERLSGLRLGQRLAPPGDSVLLFDEAEDLFLSDGSSPGERARTSRVFMHRLLERITVPTIWTANNIHALGPAVLRRMTMCLELRVPSLARRTVLWQRMGTAEGLALSEVEAGRLARLIPAAPAVAAAAVRATRLAGGGADTAQLIVEGVARAVQGGGRPTPEPVRAGGYDPALINADHDLASLAESLLRPGASPAVSLLLSGPPGAGKSAWVRHLAERMGYPLMQKRASDLLNMFVGGTEQNIAEAFAEARESRAFLVFDEADSLLVDRSQATRSWEISQVNEMLTWMESHALPFACTTNLIDRLDRASFRRFLVNIRFDWMTPGQARMAFRKFFAKNPPVGLEDLATLTPADFALVKRRLDVMAEKPDPAALLALLTRECEGRVGGRIPVGFAHSGIAA
jgi:AAA+ superfamily predicted ATPase